MRLRKLFSYLLLGLAISTIVGNSFFHNYDVGSTIDYRQHDNDKQNRNFQFTEYLSSPLNTGIYDFSRLNDFSPTGQTRTIPGSSGNELRAYHKTRVDLTLFEELQFKYNLKLSCFFYDGYYIYHLRKLLI